MVCNIADEDSLIAFLREVRRSGVQCADFQEEDLGGQTTAFATELVSGPQRRIFRKLKLLDYPTLEV